MRYIVIIYYVLIEGEQIFETLNVNKNIEANSPEEAIGIAYTWPQSRSFGQCYIVSIAAQRSRLIQQIALLFHKTKKVSFPVRVVTNLSVLIIEGQEKPHLFN